MTFSLSTLKNSSRATKKRKRVGRGPGSGTGKTAGRGGKGASARQGYKTRRGYEGGQMRLHMKLPKRGFSNVRFSRPLEAVNLGLIDKLFQEGELVTAASLVEHGCIPPSHWGVKILGKGELTKRLAGFEVDAVSASAREKIEQAKISLKVITRSTGVETA